MKIFLILIVISGFGLGVWRMKWLSAAGAVTAALFGFCLLYLGSPAWVVPVLVFFVSSSILSKLKRQSIEARSSIDRDERTAKQVLANGGVAWLMLLLHAQYPESIWFYGFLGAFAAATADTWGTEIGRITRARAYSVINGRPVKRGESGGMSLQGTIGGIFGALVIACAGLLLYDVVELRAFVAIVGAGVLGSLLDSLLGATLQARYINLQTGIIREALDEQERDMHDLHSGWQWMTNDMVNVMCTSWGAILSIAFLLLADT